MSNKPDNTQERLIRRFYVEVVSDDNLEAWHYTSRRAAVRLCLDLLGYTIYDDKIVRPEDIKEVKYGEKPQVVDRWAADTEANEAALQAENTRKADSSKPTKDTEKRKTIFS